MQTPMDELLELLKSAEIALHEPSTRRDRSKVEALLHETFLEIGRSGKCWNRAEMLDYLAAEEVDNRVFSRDFALTLLDTNVALLTYRSAKIDDFGTGSKFTLRSSIWMHTPEGWKLRFHQGTPTRPFATPRSDC